VENYFYYFTDRINLDGMTEIPIVYRDLKGNQTQRCIIPQIIGKSSSGEMYIQAFCKLRNDIRVFKLSGILALSQTPREFFEQLYYRALQTHV
jgi:predicted DNA-binding transcriptional regulator YafY